MNSLWYLPRLASDRMPTRDVSPTNLSISAINHRRLESDPGYSLYTASTNSWYDLVVSANSGRISQSSTVSQSNHTACFFIAVSSTMCDRPKWNLSSSKNRRSSRGLVGSNRGAPWSPQAGIGGITGCDIVAVRQTDLGCTGDGAGTAEGGGGFIGEGLVDLEFGRSGGGSVCDSRATAEGLNKLEGKGCGIPNSSGLEKLSWISSLRLRSRLVGREFVGAAGGSVLGVVLHLRLWLLRL